MKTITEKTPVFETKKVQIGETEKIKYIADDGTEFSSESSCQRYENNLTDIANGHGQFEFVSIVNKEDVNDDDIETAIIHLLYAAYLPSNVKSAIWTVTKDKDKIELVYKFLKAKGFYQLYTDLFLSETFYEGDKVLFISFEEDAGSDRPQYKTISMRLSFAQDLIKSRLKAFFDLK
jgi:hypothetical protein